MEILLAGFKYFDINFALQVALLLMVEDQSVKE
jgi:hypothetical protein